MKAHRITPAVPAILLCLPGGVWPLPRVAAIGTKRHARRPDHTRAPRSRYSSEPLTAPESAGRRRWPLPGATLKVTLKLSKPVKGSLLAHIHTGPCSNEPTFSNPRIWRSLNDVVDGRSQTTLDTVTLHELQSESSSINVHDLIHGNRPLVCGDIPRAG
jgi:hypothetical protein